jgi:NADPH2:quinone reductase
MPLPGGLGREAAGVVVALGRKVKGLRAGDRVAYVHSQPGTYCELRNVAADKLVKLPRAIGDAQAAAIMLKGLTAQYLLRRTYRVKRGDWMLAKRHGCHHVLVMGRDELVASVQRLTKKAGVAVVYDSVGKDTFMASLDCLAPLGMMVTYGNASGPPPVFSPAELAKRGSLFLTRPSLFAYIAKRSDLEANARELFRAVASGSIKVRIGQTYALAEAAQAHRDLEARRTTGSTVLVP